jgi:hypothetical protein
MAETAQPISAVQHVIKTSASRIAASLCPGRRIWLFVQLSQTIKQRWLYFNPTITRIIVVTRRDSSDCLSMFFFPCFSVDFVAIEKY